MEWVRVGLTELQAAAAAGDAARARDVFRRMRVQLRPDGSETLPQEAYRWLVTTWFPAGTAPSPAEAAQVPAPDVAAAVLQQLAAAFSPAPTANDYNRVVVALCQARQPGHAMALVEHMLERGVVPKLETFNALLLGTLVLHRRAAAALPEAASALVQRIRSAMLVAQHRPDAVTVTRLLQVHRNEPPHLRALVAEAATLAPRTVGLDAALVHAHLALGDRPAAVAALLQALAQYEHADAGAESRPADTAALAAAAGAALQALAAAGEFDAGVALGAALDRAGVPDAPGTIVARLHLLLRGAKQLRRAVQPWRPLAQRALALPDADAATYTAVIQCILNEPTLVQSTRRRRREDATALALDEAEAVLAEMYARGVPPDAMLLSTLLRACADWWPTALEAPAPTEAASDRATDDTLGARLDRALRLLNEARAHGVAPNAHVYTALLLCCQQPARDPQTGARTVRLDRRIDDVIASLRLSGEPLDDAVYTAWAGVLRATGETARLLQMWCTARLQTASAERPSATMADLDATVLHEAARAGAALAAQALTVFNDLRAQAVLPPPSAATLAALMRCCAVAGDRHGYEVALAELLSEWRRRGLDLGGGLAAAAPPAAAAAAAAAPDSGWEPHNVSRAFSSAIQAAASLRDLRRLEETLRHAVDAQPPVALSPSAWKAALEALVWEDSLHRAEALWADTVAAPAWGAVLPAVAMAQARAVHGRLADALSLFEWTVDRALARTMSWRDREAIAEGFYSLWTALRRAPRSPAVTAALQRLLALAERTRLDDVRILGKGRAGWRDEAATLLAARPARGGRVVEEAVAAADDGFGSSDDE